MPLINLLQTFMPSWNLQHSEIWFSGSNIILLSGIMTMALASNEDLWCASPTTFCMKKTLRVFQELIFEDSLTQFASRFCKILQDLSFLAFVISSLG